MPRTHRFSHSRLLEIYNHTDEPIENVRIHFSLWGFGSGSWDATPELKSGAYRTWSLENRRIRISSLFVTYTRPGSSEVIRTSALRTPWNGYFRWLRFSVSDSDLGGGGRIQGVPLPSYAPSFFSSEPLSEESELILTGQPFVESLPAEQKTQFIELINFSREPLHIESVACATPEGNPLEFPVDKLIRGGDFIEFDFSADMDRVAGLKINWRLDGELKSAKADFTREGAQWLRFGSAWYTGEEELFWAGLAEYQITLEKKLPKNVQLDAHNLFRAPRIVIEEDPNPQYPSAFCQVPGRIRNTESYPVAVRYSETFRSEGPANLCSNSPSTSFKDIELGAGEYRYLGCHRYRTPNMWCADVRKWKVVSASRLPD